MRKLAAKGKYAVKLRKLIAKGNQIKQKSEGRDMVNQTRKKAREKRKNKIALESDLKECFCLVCMEPFANSRLGEKWVQFTKCKQGPKSVTLSPSDK